MQAVLSSLGHWFAVPAALAALAAYGITVLLGLHRSRSQQRLEFLQLWNSVENEDDMKLEVLIRHHFGTYLPASVIRRLCAQDYCAANILELSQLWPLYRYDHRTGSVYWRESSYERRSTLRKKAVLYSIGYFLSALLSIGFAAIAINNGPTEFVSWICGLNTLLFLFIAGGSLSRSEVFSLAAKRGHDWLHRLDSRELNAHAPKTNPQGR